MKILIEIEAHWDGEPPNNVMQQRIADHITAELPGVIPSEDIDGSDDWALEIDYLTTRIES